MQAKSSGPCGSAKSEHSVWVSPANPSAPNVLKSWMPMVSLQFGPSPPWLLIQSAIVWLVWVAYLL